MLLTQILCNYRLSPSFTFPFSCDKSPNDLTLKIGKDFGGRPNSCPCLLQYFYSTAFNPTWIPPIMRSSLFYGQTFPLLGSSVSWKTLFHIELKPALLVFGVQRNLKAHQLQCHHSTDEESEAREDQAIVLSIGQIPTAGADMSKSTLSYA